MNKKIQRYLSMILLTLLTVNFLSVKPAFAASATVGLLADANEVTVGDMFTVNITIASETLFGDFEANLSYDEDILEYQGGTSEISGSSGFLKINDQGVARGSTSRKYAMKFEASQVGICKIEFQGRAMVYDFDTGNEMSVSSSPLTINVKAKETASANTNLKSLKTSPSDFSPAFDKNIYEYQLTVDYETEQLIINAIPEDPKATVSISGNDSLKVGENKISIKVIAESGAIIEYTINVIREAQDVKTDPEDTQTAEQEFKASFEAVRIDGLTYAVFQGRYQLIEPGSDVIVPNGYIKSKLIISDISVTAFTPANNLDSDFLLIYAKNEKGEEGFYSYDRSEKTLQRFIVKEENIPEKQPTPAAPVQEAASLEKYRDSLNMATVVIVLLSVLCALLLVIVIRLILKRKGFKEEDLD